MGLAHSDTSRNDFFCYILGVFAQWLIDSIVRPISLIPSDKLHKGTQIRRNDIQLWKPSVTTHIPSNIDQCASGQDALVILWLDIVSICPGIVARDGTKHAKFD